MNKMVRSCAIALGLACVAGSASAYVGSEGYWDWYLTPTGGVFDAASTWEDGVALEEFKSDENYRLRAETNPGVVTESPITLEADCQVGTFCFGYLSKYPIDATMSFGEKTLNCSAFNVATGCVARLTSGTLNVSGQAEVGWTDNNAGGGHSTFIVDGPNAKFSSTKAIIIGAYRNGEGNRVEVLNGAQFIAPVKLGRVTGASGNETWNNSFLASGEGTFVDASASTTYVGNEAYNEGLVTWGNSLTITDGAKMKAAKIYIGGGDARNGSSNNVFTVANGAELTVGGTFHMGANGAPGNMFVVSNAVVDIENVEFYHPEEYANGTVCLAGTNTCVKFDDHGETFRATQKLILDVSGRQVQEQMALSTKFVFEEGSKLFVTSSKDLSDVDSFEVVALATRKPKDKDEAPMAISIADGVLEIDPTSGLEVDLTTDPTKLIIRHTKAEKKTGTCIFIR